MWQFEFPLSLGQTDWQTVMSVDAFNNCGGSAYRLPGGTVLVAFTAMSQAPSEHNANLTRTAYAWEVDTDTARTHMGGERGAEVKATMRIPIPHDDAGLQNGYRVVPWHSIAGEQSTPPWS